MTTILDWIATFVLVGSIVILWIVTVGLDSSTTKQSNSYYNDIVELYDSCQGITVTTAEMDTLFFRQLSVTCIEPFNKRKIKHEKT